MELLQSFLQWKVSRHGIRIVGLPILVALQVIPGRQVNYTHGPLGRASFLLVA